MEGSTYWHRVGVGSAKRDSVLSDKDLVESVLRELSEAADKWEALVAQAETVTYSVDLGDIHAVANSDGRLLKLTLHPDVMTGYAHGELADRLNLAIAALREEAEAENQDTVRRPVAVTSVTVRMQHEPASDRHRKENDCAT